MQLDNLHPLDRDKICILGERLCDLSAGHPVERVTLCSLVANLMSCTSTDCSAAGADRVVERLLAIADWRLGAVALAEAALVEIALERAR